jgi:hypothetical protein
MRTIRSSVKEFWALVEETSVPFSEGISPCWEWKGSPAYSGYYGFRSVLAHRAAATIYCGQIPSNVRQMCGNKKCMRIDHLSISTESNFDVIKDEHKKPGVIEKVLAARGTSRYTVNSIKNKTGFQIKVIRKVLREAPLYDLLREVQQCKRNGIPVQMKPNSTVIHEEATTADTPTGRPKVDDKDEPVKESIQHATAV